MQATQKAIFWVKTRALFRAGLQNLDESVIGRLPSDLKQGDILIYSYKVIFLFTRTKRSFHKISAHFIQI